MAVAIGVLISMASKFSTYSSFADSAAKPDKNVQIVGQLSKEKPIEYNPEVDPNKFSFYMTDSNGEEAKVIYLDAKPQDFERSEEIVLTGKMVGEEFHASDLLMKCPSKYKDEEMYIKSEKI